MHWSAALKGRTDMSYFYRTVYPMVSECGTKYTMVRYSTGKCDITIRGVTFRNMSDKEQQFLHYNI